MKRIFNGFLVSALLACFGSFAALAQDSAEPIVEVELSATEVVPGQASVLRVTVLVPTWMPQPVVFPPLEAPDLMVKLLEQSTSPTSRTIEGETWSGVSRAYRLSPMVPGPVQVPAQELTIYWAEPGRTDPLVAQVALDPLTLTGVVPDGAGELDPFIAANALRMTEELSTDERTLRPGDSLTRTITLEVSGTSPLFVPPLLPPHQIEGMASYPAEPSVTETADRSWVSGTRVESTTLVAESGGSGSVPAIEVQWFNLESGAVETTTIDGFDITVDGPVARTGPMINWRLVGLLGLLGLAAAFGAIRLLRWSLPKWRAWRAERLEAFEATEEWAFRQVEHAVRARDYDGLLNTVPVWLDRLSVPRPEYEGMLSQPLTVLGACFHGTAPTSPETAWRDMSKVLTQVRGKNASATAAGPHRGSLAELNPSSAA